MALDVDGTLLDAGGVIAPAVRATVRRCLPDAHVVVATGRSVLGTLAVLEALGLADGTAVCSNGAVRVDVASGVPTALADFDPAPALGTLDEALPGARYAVERLGEGHLVSGEFPPGALTGTTVAAERIAMVREPTTRAIAWWSGLDVLNARLALEHIELPGATATLDLLHLGGNAWLTMVARGVSKASALAVVCNEVGVARADVLAIGDGTNDIEMLRWAGRGVAMGQAPAEVRDAADAVAAPVGEDGVARELERWF